MIYAWKTDKDLNPVGDSWSFNSDDIKYILQYLAAKNRGKINGRHIILPDGDRIFLTLKTEDL